MGRPTNSYVQSVAASPVAAHPNRPKPPRILLIITPYGVLELEYGWDHQWPESGIQQTSVRGLLKFALLCDVELSELEHNFIPVTDGLESIHSGSQSQLAWSADPVLSADNKRANPGVQLPSRCPRRVLKMV
jgi:hypothetical protein